MPGLEVCIVFFYRLLRGFLLRPGHPGETPARKTSQLFDQLAPVVDEAFKYLPTAPSSGQTHLLQLTCACERVGFNFKFWNKPFNHGRPDGILEVKASMKGANTGATPGNVIHY